MNQLDNNSPVIVLVFKNIVKFESIRSGFYISGLDKIMLPRTFRKLIAGTEIHRAWISGKIGRFSEFRDEGEIEHGICGYFNDNGLINS